MLEMTEASVVPSNQSVAAQTERSVSAMPQAYARDVAITAVICFTGGAGLALLLVLVCYQAIRRRKLTERERQKEEEKDRRAVVGHDVDRLDEKRRNVSPQWDRESMTLDTRTENHSGHFQSRAAEENGHFRCPDCCHKGQRGLRPNPITWNNRMHTEMEEGDEGETRTMGLVTEDDRRKPGFQQGILSRDVHNRANLSAQPRREAFSERPENLPVYETGRDMDSFRSHVDGKSTGHETSHCESCHRAYRGPQQAIVRDSAVFNGFPPQHWIDKSRRHNQFDIMKNTGLRRESRNVTFDMESLRILEQGRRQGEDKRDEGVGTSRRKERERGKQAKIQSSRLLKVKLNLNPLRKSKVHPKKRKEQDHAEKGGSKKSRGQRQRGKDRPEEGRKGKSPGKSRRSSDGGVDVKEEEDEEDGKQEKTVFENEQTVQEQNTCPENSQSGDATSAEDRSSAAVAPGQVPTPQGGSVQHQPTGLVLGGPSSRSAAESTRITNLPLLGSHLTGSRLSLQGGNLLLNNMAPGFKALFTGGPTNSAAPSISISGPNMAAGGTPESFSSQTGGGIMSAANSLLASTVHANAFQANPIQAAALQTSQAGGIALNLAANPAVNPEPIQSLLLTQLPPDSSSLIARLNSEPVHALGLETGKVLPQPAPESQAPQIQESLPVQAQATDGLSVVSSQALGSVSTVDPVTGRAPDAGSAVVAEGAAAGGSGDSMQAAEVPVSDVGGDAADTAVLLHQEYLSEEGDSSPRRKLRLALPEKTSSRPLTALERKIR